MASSVSASKNRGNKGRHRVRKQSTAVTAAASAAVVAGLVSGAGATAAAPSYQLAPQDCVAGSNAVKSNVDCSGSTAPVVGTLVKQVIPSQISQILTTLGIGVDSKAVVVAGNGTASIKGSGFTIAANTLSGLLQPSGGAAKATAVDPFSGAVAISTGSGNATSTGTLGVAITAASAGQSAEAFALGGLASAINVKAPLLSPVTNVSCLAVFGTANASGVGSCTSVLFIFTQRNAAGSPITYFSIADPTSFTLGDGVIPIPRFTRDLIRIGIGGPTGITVESGLAPQLGSGTPTPSIPGFLKFTTVPASQALGKTVTSNARTVTSTHVSDPAPTPEPEPETAKSPEATPQPVEPATITPPPVETTSNGTSAGTGTSTGTWESTSGTHRKADTDTSTGFTITPTGSAASSGTSSTPGTGSDASGSTGAGASSGAAGSATDAPA